MRKIKVHSVEPGLIQSERLVRILGKGGSVEEVSVSERQVEGELLLASEVGRQGSAVLIELPRESASGKWRMWVDSALVQQ